MAGGSHVLVLAAIALLVPATGAHAAAPPPPELPEPTLQSVSQEVLIPMDDGVKLGATIALPSEDGQTPLPGPFPVVVGMTPYSRNGLCGCFPPDFFATRGIAGAVVDVRGTGGSGGNLEGNFFSPREARDSYNVIEYLGTQPWSTGKVGMAGGSYVGITQYLAAGLSPPHLAAITPAVAISDLYREGYTHGGVPNFFFDTQYIGVQGAPGAAGANNDPYLLDETLKAKLGQSAVGTIAFDYLERPNDDAFYRDRSPIYTADEIEVPTLILGGWRDGLLRGAPEMYQRLAQRKGVETRLYVDPCTHKGCGAPLAPLTNGEGVYDASALAFEFLQKHLAGANTPERPAVEYYVQGRDEYATAESWPPADVEFGRLELDAGELVPDAPQDAGTQEFVTNPVAGFSMAFDRFGTVAASPYVPADQRLEGPSGLTFRTPELEEPMFLAGPLALHLVAASTAPDTDWHAKVTDVAPDGSEAIISDGALRASHRELDPAKSTPTRPYHTHTNPQPIEPGEFYEYDVEIWPTAYELAPGHRLQLRITSTDLPTHLPGSIAFDRDDPAAAQINLNSPGTNTVKLGESYLTVPLQGKAEPLVPRECKKTKPRKTKVRRGVKKRIRTTLTRGGRPVQGALIRLRGAGVKKHARTNDRGKVSFVVRPGKTGRVTVRTPACGAKLRLG
ncbi:MAG: CocE/NonD family hydrolase [Thermoleophilaceae bacterium]